MCCGDGDIIATRASFLMYMFLFLLGLSLSLFTILLGVWIYYRRIIAVLTYVTIHVRVCIRLSVSVWGAHAWW
jgi:hypothetical protein